MPFSSCLPIKERNKLPRAASHPEVHLDFCYLWKFVRLSEEAQRIADKGISPSPSVSPVLSQPRPKKLRWRDHEGNITRETNMLSLASCGGCIHRASYWPGYEQDRPADQKGPVWSTSFNERRQQRQYVKISWIGFNGHLYILDWGSRRPLIAGHPIGGHTSSHMVGKVHDIERYGTPLWEDIPKWSDSIQYLSMPTYILYCSNTTTHGMRLRHNVAGVSCAEE